MSGDIEKMFKDWTAAWNSHDAAKIALFFTEDGVHEDIAVGNLFRGREEIKAGLAPLFSSSPDFKLEQKSFFTSGGWAAQEWVMSGTMTGSIKELGIATSGKQFSVRGSSIANLQGNKILHNTDYWNLNSMLEQLRQS